MHSSTAKKVRILSLLEKKLRKEVKERLRGEGD